ncbi:MAG: ribokinase [Bifidobacteriaceae bacterium]|nr:ribokinase [Bifidobacteriaceae bacterium]
MGENEALALLNNINGTIAVVGSMNADYTVVTPRLPNPGETVLGGALQILPGGKSGNQAAAAARIGANVKIFGAVGSDDNADFLLEKLNDAGVDTAHVRRVAGASGTTVITVDEHGENTIVYSPGANAAVSVGYISSMQDMLCKASVLGLCLESPMETVTACAKICHNKGVKVLLNNSPFKETLPQELVENADVLLVNEHEMAQLLKIDEPEDGDWLSFDWESVVPKMKAYGFNQAIITLGGDGSMILDSLAPQHVTHVKAAPIKPVDTTGCGDAFMGTILAGLSSGYTLSQSAQMASFVAAYAAMDQGAQASYGTSKEIIKTFSK